MRKRRTERVPSGARPNSGDMRVFIGVRISPRAAERLDEWLDPIRPRFARKIKWVAPGDFHVTLAFLGEVAGEGGLTGVKARMDAAASGTGGINAVFGRLGAFPSLERPRVWWLGFEEGAEELKALAFRLRAGLMKEGFSFDSEMVPHLTLGRARGRVDGGSPLQDAGSLGCPGRIRETFSSIELIESRVSGRGAAYRTLCSSGLL